MSVELIEHGVPANSACRNGCPSCGAGRSAGDRICRDAWISRAVQKVVAVPDVLCRDQVIRIGL